MPTESEKFLPTRRSLLTKLKDFDNHDSWREFFNTYWRLIYDVARKAGLADDAAQEAVQETFISVAAEMPGFKYDPAAGSFKAWLYLITRRRIADQLRKKYRVREATGISPDDPVIEAEISARTDAPTPVLDALWDEEWRTHLLEAALERVKQRVRPDHFQLFHFYAVKGWSVKQVAQTFHVSQMQVYLARHRIGGLVKKELQRLGQRLN